MSYLQSCHNYIIENNDNVKLLLTQIRKIYINTSKSEISIISKISLSTKTIIGKKEIDVSIKIK